MPDRAFRSHERQTVGTDGPANLIRDTETAGRFSVSSAFSVGNLPAVMNSVRWHAAWLLLAVVLAYAYSLRAPFLFDDAGAVVDNPTIRNLASFDVLRPPADGSTTTGRPVVNLSFALNRALTGDAPGGYRAGNILLHALATLTLFGLLRRTLRQRERLAFTVALLWALHPLQTESVVCIAQRTEVLCGLLVLVTLYAFARGTDAAAGAATGRPRWLAGSLAACLLGMATKELMVVTPVLVLLYDRTFRAGRFRAALRERAVYYAGLAATWLLLLALLLEGGGGRGASAGFGLGVTPWTYLLTQADALVHYLRLALWPHPLVLDYGTILASSLADVWWQGGIVLVLLAATAWALVRRPVAGFAGAWCCVLLAPSSSVVPLVTQTVAEHRMYLPLAALTAGAVVVVSGWLGRRAQGIAAAAAVALGLISALRTHDYRSEIAIWTDTVGKVPDNARAHNNLALAWRHAGDEARASQHYARAIQLQPDYVSARYNWGVTLLELGGAAEAVVQLETAVRLAPEHVDARVNLGNALVRAQRSAEAVPVFEAALRMRPAGDIRFNYGVALLELGRRAEAATQFEAALQHEPQLAGAHAQLGRLAEADGRSDEALRRYLEALRLAPDDLLAHARVGLLLARAGNYEGAAQHFRALTRLQPDNADAHANLGNALLGLGRPREAIASYEIALRLRPDDPRTRENIAIAHQALR
jgi:tetratricopeptide (TPR) repeat protein